MERMTLSNRCVQGKYRPLFLLFPAVALFFAVSCQQPGGPSGADDDPDTQFSVAKSNVSRETTPVSGDVLSEQAASINTFALRMYQQLCSQEQGNIFFSPYSIVAALGMTEAGARGETMRQIREALAVTLEGDAFHAAMNGLDLSLTEHTGSTSGLTLNMVNTTWVRKGMTFLPEYLDLLARYYGAGVNVLDFTNEPEPSRIIINTWVADQTNQKIKDLIPPGSISGSTALVLTNAIYFLADWLNQFDAAQTRDESFDRLDNSVVTAPLMQLGENGKTVKMMYGRAGNACAIDLPYKGNRLCMTVILPDKGVFDAFQGSLTVQNVNNLIAALDSTALPPVRLPKFKYTSGSISLVGALKALGMIQAFIYGSADFSGIFGSRDQYLSDVIHKAFISVDEKGTEAAAATAVIIYDSVGDTSSFIANRPFIFIIRDRLSGAILFMGRILDPRVEG
jgi:serpin B